VDDNNKKLNINI